MISSKVLRSLIRGVLWLGLFFAWMIALPLWGQVPLVKQVGVDAQGQFVVQAELEAGMRHAVLEVLGKNESNAWRSMVAGGLDGRRAKVTFRLPKSAPVALARVRTGKEETVPAAELRDPTLFSVNYPSDTAQAGPIWTMLDGADEYYQTISQLPRPQLHAAQVAWAKSFPIVEDAWVSTISDIVCIQYKDGTKAALINGKRREGDLPENRIARPQGRASTPPVAVKSLGVRGAALTANPTVSVPGSRKAICAYSLEPHIFTNSTPKAGRWLQAAHYDTTVSSREQTTVLNILGAWSSQLEPLGLLFWQTHSYVWHRETDGKQFGCIVTGESAFQNAQGKWDHPLMVEMDEVSLAKDSESKDPPLYTITDIGIRKYMHFAPHSLVMLDSCEGADPLLAGAFIDAGAGAVGSWNVLSGIDSGTPMLRVLDRLVGANEASPVSNPPERSFALPIVQQWMKDRGYDYDPSPKGKNQKIPNARLTWRVHPAAPAYILRPSIMRIPYRYSFLDLEHGDFSKFLLEGDFGDDPGEREREVLWGGQSMRVLRWSKDAGILIQPPLVPPVGDFEVVIKKQFRSNLTPMSEWTIPFQYQYTSVYNPLRYEMDMNIKIRADVHGFRAKPEEPVSYMPMDFATLGDCTGQVRASGTHWIDDKHFITWSGGTSMKSVDVVVGQKQPVDTVECLGTLDPSAGTLGAIGLGPTGRYTSTTSAGSGLEIAHASPLISPPPAPKFDLATYGIITDFRKFEDGFGSTASLSWPTVRPAAAPTNKTPR